MIQRSRPLAVQVGVPVLAAEVVVVSTLIVAVWPAVAEADSGALKLTVVVAAFVAVLLPLVAVWIASLVIARQARQMSTAAEHFGRSDFSVRVASASSTELVTLAVALDDMGVRLNARLAELQMQQRQQRAILQSMSNAVLAVDTEQRVVMVNRAAEHLLELRADSVRGRLLQEVIRQSQLHEFVRRALAEPQPQQTELQLHGAPRKIVQATSGPMTTSDDAAAGVLMVLNDVTELRRLESLRSEFAANVSHELRTPITNLKGYVETLLEVGMDDQEQSTRFLNIIQHNVDRLAAIVDDVMALTEFERPRSPKSIERIVTSIRDISTNVIEQFSFSAAAKKVTLQLSVHVDLRVEVQRGLIEQAVGNLVSNAIAYSPPQTTVTIESQMVSDDEVEIAVVDEGPGIAEEHLSRLFERFYRVDSARSREAGGTGLGLAIVKHIAVSQGGRVDVASTLGHGSRFVIILPRG